MKSPAEKVSLDMWNSLVRGDPRDVFPALRSSILEDFQTAYQYGERGDNESTFRFKVYKLSMIDGDKLSCLIHQTYHIGKQAREIAMLKVQK